MHAHLKARTHHLRRKTFAEWCDGPAEDEEARSAQDLVARMLVLDPRERISVEAALRHPFLRARPQRRGRESGDSMWQSLWQRVTGTLGGSVV